MPDRLTWRVLGGAFVLVAVPPLQSPMLAQEMSEQARRQVDALLAEKGSRTPDERKLATSLLYAYRQSRGEAMVSALPSLPGLSRVVARAGVQAGMAVVDVKAEVTESLLEAIVGIGGSVVSSHPAYGALRARIPIQRIDELAARSEVRFVAPEERYVVNAGSVTSQGDTAHVAAATRTSLAVNGTGVKVCVLSDGVGGLANRQATGDLPPGVTIVPGQAGAGNEGTAMLEIVHDLAPGAQLFFATALGGQAAFAANILTLRNSYGCDIIIDDWTYYAEAAFQDGIVAQAVNSVTAQGALFFSSAANSGSKNKGTSGTWEGDFLDSLDTYLNRPLHSFNGIVGALGASSNQVTQPGGAAVTLKWSDRLGGSGNDYDLYIFDSLFFNVVDWSTDFQGGSQDPVEETGSGAEAGERVVVMLYSGTTRALRVDTHRGQLGISTAGSVFGHNGGASTISVAATDVRPVGGGPFTAPRSVESYSSDGPRRLFYNPNGTPITPGNVLFGTGGGQTLQKPDLTAADCGLTTSPGFLTFCGTSAAAPHAGAIAALLKSLPTRPSGGQVQAAMYSTAIDIEAAGRDRDSGVGIVMANLAGAALANIPATRFYTLTPCRLVDTRNPNGPLGGPALTCGFERVFTAVGACGIPTGAKAVSINATVAGASASGNLRLYASGAPAPTASSLNWSTGITRGNNAIIPLDSAGRLEAKCTPSGTTHFILDVNGYFR